MTDSQILLKAAKMIDDGTEHYTCAALDVSSECLDSRLRLSYSCFYETEPLFILWFSEKDWVEYDDLKNLRVLLLLNYRESLKYE